MYFIILPFSIQIILMFFINHALKLNTHPSYLKVNIHHFRLQCQKPFYNNHLYQRLHEVDPFLKNGSCSADYEIPHFYGTRELNPGPKDNDNIHSE